MNPSYDNGGPVGASNAGGTSGVGGVPGVKPGVIASGPSDTPAAIASGPNAMDAPNMPATPVPNAPVVSRQPTGRRPASSEIILAPSDGTKKRKRNLIIAGVVAGVLVLVGVVVAVVMLGRGNGGSVEIVNIPSFNRLINYVTSGEDSDVEITEPYNDFKDYYFSSDFDSEDIKIAVYDETKEMVDFFVEAYQNTDNQTLNDSVEAMGQMYDFMYVVDLKTPISEFDATIKIIKNGATVAKEELLNYYDFSGLSDNIYVESFMESFTGWIDAMIEEVDFFRENNCVNGEYMILSCIVNKGNKDIIDRWNELAEKVRDFYEAWGVSLDNRDDFVMNVYAVNDLMQGRAITVDEGDMDE